MELRTHRGEEILTHANLHPQKSSVGKVAVLEIPASVLNGGDYELTLKGISGGQATEIGYYDFSVRKK